MSEQTKYQSTYLIYTIRLIDVNDFFNYNWLRWYGQSVASLSCFDR